MLSTVMIAMAGLYLLMDLGVAALAPKPTILGANLIGGLIFGLGWGLLGYCPGTAVGALGEGRWDAFWGILGMLAGATVFAEIYPALKSTVLTWGDYGRITLPQVLGINHWFIILVFILGGIGLCRWFENQGL
ncbi:MAG: YeeE/YedE family protein [Deltaproteobacteria bacterium]|nr:YeeE/YedE family protein [Deltaproteobacteria bacterium]